MSSEVIKDDIDLKVIPIKAVVHIRRFNQVADGVQSLWLLYLERNSSASSWDVDPTERDLAKVTRCCVRRI